uniref:Uncharacterized protein n=1 Tax=Rhizophora mucronata TaxID=61149 RepID=A0A2P2QJD7_RHIMU
MSTSIPHRNVGAFLCRIFDSSHQSAAYAKSRKQIESNRKPIASKQQCHITV